MPAERSGIFETRGHVATVDAVRAMVASTVPHAILLSGPPSSGKTTLALDLAAALLCESEEPAGRPCRACRGCRLVASGNHPDLHRLAPSGAGRQIVLGEPGAPEPGTVRRLVADLALSASEGGERVAVIEDAGRMNEDAQNALLKVLEEPPPRTTIVLCGTDDARLLPTVLSRCARLRLGPVGIREIEALLAVRGLADPPTAARLARLAHGRPGIAAALAAAPEAVTARGELARTILDLLGSGRATRLARVRELQAGARALAEALAGAAPEATGSAATKGRKGKGKTAAGAAAAAPAGGSVAVPVSGGSEAGDEGSEAAPEAEASSGGKASPAVRRANALALLAVWGEVARDLLVLIRGGRDRLADPGLLDELTAAAAGIDPTLLALFLARLERTARLIEGNANPELALDVLVLAWPHRGDRAADPAAPGGASDRSAAAHRGGARAASASR